MRVLHDVYSITGRFDLRCENVTFHKQYSYICSYNIAEIFTYFQFSNELPNYTYAVTVIMESIKVLQTQWNLKK